MRRRRQLDRIFGHEEEGLSYSRYANPTNAALEELTTALENGHGSLATTSGMTALQIAFQAALLDKPHSIVSSRFDLRSHDQAARYGAGAV